MSGHYVLWLTGLSGSGKSTLAKGLAKLLKEKKFAVEIIDGDQFRKKVHVNLGFTPKEIKLNNKNIINYCLENFGKRNFLLVPVIAPFSSTRNLARKKLGKNYVEIFCKATLEACIKRDTKGLYKKALNGKIENFIGIHKNVPYQIPKHPDLVVNTVLLNKQQSLKKALEFLESKNII